MLMGVPEGTSLLQKDLLKCQDRTSRCLNDFSPEIARVTYVDPAGSSARPTSLHANVLTDGEEPNCIDREIKIPCSSSRI